jgi:wyosine [tRNA(Phe)-imidazoG37] synthetase (radical SAM superfamily)
VVSDAVAAGTPFGALVAPAVSSGHLTIFSHDRDASHMRYVYPVVSRRSGGLSIGINLNPNQACNWRCVYCQVPDLRRGKGPPIDRALLEQELRAMLEDVVHGDFMQRAVPEGARVLADVAFSGNGEPTTSPDFRAGLDLVARVLTDFGLLPGTPLVVISNGSLVQRKEVQAALVRLGELGGTLWFKLDAATRGGARLVQDPPIDPAEHVARLRQAARLCPTWIQTCLFELDGATPSEQEQDAYVELVRELVVSGAGVRGVHLYTVARPSLQPEAPRIKPLTEAWLRQFADRIEEAGLEVRVSP